MLTETGNMEIIGITVTYITYLNVQIFTQSYTTYQIIYYIYIVNNR
jgi:hypothetical protein